MTNKEKYPNLFKNKKYSDTYINELINLPITNDTRKHSGKDCIVSTDTNTYQIGKTYYGVSIDVGDFITHIHKFICDDIQIRESRIMLGNYYGYCYSSEYIFESEYDAYNYMKNVCIEKIKQFGTEKTEYTDSIKNIIYGWIKHIDIINEKIENLPYDETNSYFYVLKNTTNNKVEVTTINYDFDYLPSIKSIQNYTI